MLITRTAFGALAWAIVVGYLFAGDWPQYLGPNRDGTSDQKGSLRAWLEAGPEILWTVPVGKGYGGPVVKDGQVYPLGGTTRSAAIFAVRVPLMAELWSYACDAPGTAMFPGSRGVPPFSSFLSFPERIKRSWEDPRGAAPIPHAELLTLKELAGKAEVPLETALQQLAEKGVKGATAEIVMSTLAEQNDLSAQRVYEIMHAVYTQTRGGGGRGPGAGAGEKSAVGKSGESGHRPGGGGGGGGGGWGGGGGPGRMTLTEFCESRKIDVKQAQARLEAKGTKLAPGRTLRDIAVDNGYERPYEIMDIIEGKTK
jgi:hypothetical protein